jgi:hypothetical protein
MSPRLSALLVLAAIVTGGLSAVAIAATANSVSVEVSNSKSLRRLALYSDISECDEAGGYGCYTASASIYSKTGKRLFHRTITFSSAGKATVRYPWSCKHTGRLQWRVQVSDGTAKASRSGRFNVRACSG